MGLASRNTAKGITAMSKKNTNVKKPAAKKNAKPSASPAASLMPAPEVLAAVPSYDKKEKRWELSICEGKLEHTVLNETFETDDAAKTAGDEWLTKYAKTDEAGRRKMLGWKPAKGSAKIGDLAETMAKKVTGGKKADATAADATPKAKREPKAKTESTRGPSGLDVAAQMLKDSGAPMKCKEMVEQMIAKGLWATNGKTPSATIYAAIIREIAEKGEASHFKKTGRGEFEYNAASEKA